MTTTAHSSLTGTNLHTPFQEGTSAPGSPTSGMYWLNTSTMVLKRYNGSAWIEVSPAPINPAALPIYESGFYVDPWVGVVPGTVSSNIGYLANQSWAVPVYFSKDVTIDAFAIPVSQAAASGKKAKAALFSPDTTGLAGTKIVASGEIAIDSTGVKIGTISSTALSKGLYWIAVVANDAFSTYAVTNPVTTPIAYQLDTGAAKSMTRVPVNYVDEFGSTWNKDSATIAYGGGAYRFAVRIA